MTHPNEDSQHILQQIESLERELAALKAKLPNKPTVNVPEAIKPIFDQAEQTVKAYFDKLQFNPAQGSIQINDERYILVRASALSNEFFEKLAKIYPDKEINESFLIARDFLFDLGHLIGIEDAARFHNKMNLADPIAKLSAGPVHFAYSGWAFVDILPESNPQPNEDFFLKYHHPYSFEADSWISSGKKSDAPVCVMNAAYSSGWCSQSFGIQLTAVEISCRAKGDEHCTFIMAQPQRIQHFLDRELKSKTPFESSIIPAFFERKKVEESLLKNEKMFATAQKMAKMGSWEFDLSTNELNWSDELYRIFDVDPNTEAPLIDAYYSRIFNDEDVEMLQYLFGSCVSDGKNYECEHQIRHQDGTIRTIQCSGMPYFDDQHKVIRVYGTAQDITDIRHQQDKLKTSLHEKELLLKEVHHRVKNNLQIISSLLNLQAGLIDSPRVNEMYRESRNRIKSIASIHEMLYQSSDLSKVKFEDYLKKLLVDLISTYYGYENKINFSIACEVNFNLDTAIPLGLIVNEIISNALKHGIKNEAGNNLYVRISPENEEHFLLEIGDNGPGFDFKEAEERGESLGLMIITELSGQLEGKMEFNNREGSHYRLVFHEIHA